jgi:hypothetical protein
VSPRKYTHECIEAVIATASLTYANGTPRYPQRYIAALFGLPREYVSLLAARRGLPRRRRYAAKEHVIPK